MKQTKKKIFCVAFFESTHPRTKLKDCTFCDCFLHDQFLYFFFFATVIINASLSLEMKGKRSRSCNSWWELHKSGMGDENIGICITSWVGGLHGFFVVCEPIAHTPIKSRVWKGSLSAASFFCCLPKLKPFEINTIFFSACMQAHTPSTSHTVIMKVVLLSLLMSCH